MKYLNLKKREIRERIAGKNIYLFLDYDGTLTPIVKTPGSARLSDKAKRILRKTIDTLNTRVAIVSGRAAEDLRKLVNLDGIIYVGNHGLEIQCPKLKFKSGVSDYFPKVLGEIKDRLVRAVSGFKGVFVEDKGLTLTLHYRLALRKCTRSIKKIFYEITTPYLDSGRIRISEGKEILEVRPFVKWDKGKAVLWLLCRYRFLVKDKDILPIYIGDDLTDEDAFRALKSKGLSVFVGKPKNTAADYYLKNSGEVLKFLESLICVN